MRFKEEILCRLRSWKEGMPASPLRLILYLTARCPLRCPFCEVPLMWKRGHSEPELPLSRWLSIVREGLGMGVLDWWFPGQGEPFYDTQRALSIAREIKTCSPRASCHFTTSGTLLSQKICEELVRIGVDELNFSIDGPDAETHDFMRGTTGAFKKSVGAMRRLAALKEEFGMDKPGLIINTVLSARTYRGISGIIGLAAEVGATKITVNPLRISEGNRELLEEGGLIIRESEKASVAHVLQEAVALARQRQIHLHLNGWGEVQMGVGSKMPAEGFGRTSGCFTEAACFEPFYSMGIGLSGKATFCASASDVGTPDADVSRYGLGDVWFGRFMIEARARMMNHRPALQCVGCGVKSMRKDMMEEMLHRG